MAQFSAYIMGRKKNVPKVDYDHTYPPLNQPLIAGSEMERPRQTAFQALMAQAGENRTVVIPPSDRRFKNGNPQLEDTIQQIRKTHGVRVNYTSSNLGSLCLEIKASNSVSEKTIKFILLDALSLQTKRTLKLDECFLRRFADKRNQHRLLTGRYASIRVDFSKGLLLLEGGKESVRLVGEEIEEFITWNTNSASVSLDIPRVYHNFIRGVNNENLKCIVENSGRFVDVSFSDNVDGVSLSGNKRCVEKARESILQYYDDLKASLKRMSFSLSRVQQTQIANCLPVELFETQGVSVDFTEIDETACCFDAVGESEKLDILISTIEEVLDRFSSLRVPCPYWICRHLSSMTEFFEALTFLFPSSVCTIYSLKEFIEITSPSDVVTDASKKISSIVNDISNTLAYETIIISDVLWRNLDSHNRARLHDIESVSLTNFYFETGVDNPSIIEKPVKKPDVLCTIVGECRQVSHAKRLLEEVKNYFDSFISTAVNVPNHLHRYLIGTKGKTLKAVIDKFGPGCEVAFGKDEPDLDNCFVRGPPVEVEAVVASLRGKTVEFGALHHLIIIDIPPNVSHLFVSDCKNLITSLKQYGALEFLDFPPLMDHIVIMGKKDVVTHCEAFLRERISVLSESIEKETKIPSRIQPFLSEFGDSLLKTLCDYAGGGLHAELSSTNPAKTLKLIGPLQNVNNGMQVVKQMALETDYSFEQFKIALSIFPAIKSAIPSLIGESCTRALFSPSKQSDTVLLVGKPAEVSQLKKTILDRIHILQNTIEKSISIKAQYKKEFLKKQGNEPTLVQRLSAEHNNVRITLGERHPNAETVSLSVKGFKDDVERLFAVVDTLVRKFDSRIEQSVDFDILHLNTVLSFSRFLLRSTMNQFDVVISVSEEYYSAIKAKKMEGHCKMYIRGLPDDVEHAITYLRHWEVVSVTVACPRATQRPLFGPKSPYGSIGNNMMVTLELGCDFDSPEEAVLVSGLKADVEEAVSYMRQVVEENFHLEVAVPRRFFTRLVGKKGSFINKFNADNHVRVSVPFDVADAAVTVTGKRQDCEAAVEKLKHMVETWDSTVIQEFEFDARIRQQLVGPDSTHLRKIGADCEVLLRMVPPTEKSALLRRIRATGLPKNVEKALSVLKSNVDNLMEELEELHMYKAQVDQSYHLDLSALSSMVYVDPKKRQRKKGQASSKDNINTMSVPSTDSQQSNLPEVPVDSL